LRIDTEFSLNSRKLKVPENFKEFMEDWVTLAQLKTDLTSLSLLLVHILTSLLWNPSPSVRHASTTSKNIDWEEPPSSVSKK
jgi:hypothetical protein